MNEALELLTRLIQEGFGQGRLEVVDEVLSPDFVENQFGMQGYGNHAVRNVKAAITDLRSMIPDITFTVEDSVTDGDSAWARMTAHGTNTGPLFGRPASGQTVTITGFEWVRARDGHIVEHWGVPDRFAMLAQVGVLDSLAGSPAGG